ncbi:acyl-CoA thioesterase [Xanthobacter sp. TB0136]|uniref:acyl-CoA thioesterase n=1 Tax=Xanthobacter sp. TB0136 TaxID=3459177 RepID=UPI00403993DF
MSSSAESNIETLLSILDLEPLEINLFRGITAGQANNRVFGGQVIAQALVAARRTVKEARIAHSLHGYFLLPGDPSIPIIYEVERIRDGGSFTTRRVVAIQRGEAIFSMAASFQVLGEGLEHQSTMPDVPMPEDLPPDTVWREKLLARFPAASGRGWMALRPLEVRPVGDMPYMGTKSGQKSAMWLRTTAPLPDDLPIHQAILAYASDLTLIQGALLPHGHSVLDGALQVASLDHALWFHRPFRIDEWLLYSQDTPNAGAQRGFARGEVFTREGVLVASTVQEGLMRPIVRRDPAQQ